MTKSNHEGKTTSVETPFKKESPMKASNNRKKNIGSYAIFTFIAAGLMIITFGLISQPALAKEKGWYGPSKSPDEIVQTLRERLDLSADQVAAVRPIIEEKSRLMKEMRDTKGLYRKEARSEKHRIMWNADMQMGKILNDNQVDAYLELKQEQRKQMHRGKFDGRKMHGQDSKTPAQKIERLSTLLNLTGEQKIQIEPIIKESMAKKQLVRQAMRDDMQAIGDETHEQLSTILTSEQMEELNAIQEERGARKDRRMDRPGRKGY